MVTRSTIDWRDLRAPAAVLLVATLVLLPWGAFLPLGALHEHAQWPDAVFALATLAWAAAQLQSGRRARVRPVHAWLALYLGWAALSLALASPRPPSGAPKLLGMAMLAALFAVTSDIVGWPGLPAAIGRAIAVTSLAVAIAAVAAFVLALLGVATPLVGAPGDLRPTSLPRVQGGFSHPNLLASWCVFASALVARADAGLSRRVRCLVQVALAVTVLLTVSRAILAFALSAALRHASTTGRRRLAALLALATVLTFPALTLWNVQLDTSRPWAIGVAEQSSPRLQAARTSLEALARHPLFGLGPGSSVGSHAGHAMDAHLTPLNVAATLGLPALLALVLLVAALWRARARPTDRTTWGLLAGLGVDGLAQDVEDFRHVWIALGLADAGRQDERARDGEHGSGAEPLVQGGSR